MSTDHARKGTATDTLVELRPTYSKTGTIASDIAATTAGPPWRRMSVPEGRSIFT